MVTLIRDSIRGAKPRVLDLLAGAPSDAIIRPHRRPDMDSVASAMACRILGPDGEFAVAWCEPDPVSVRLPQSVERLAESFRDPPSKSGGCTNILVDHATRRRAGLAEDSSVYLTVDNHRVPEPGGEWNVRLQEVAAVSTLFGSILLDIESRIPEERFSWLAALLVIGQITDSGWIPDRDVEIGTSLEAWAMTVDDRLIFERLMKRADREVLREFRCSPFADWVASAHHSARSCRVRDGIVHVHLGELDERATDVPGACSDIIHTRGLHGLEPVLTLVTAFFPSAGLRIASRFAGDTEAWQLQAFLRSFCEGGAGARGGRAGGGCVDEHDPDAGLARLEEAVLQLRTDKTLEPSSS